MLCLLHNQFLWPGMATQMQKAISSYEQYIQHEGFHAKAPMWPIIVTTPLELLHVDFTSIETMMELDQPLYKRCYGICDCQSNSTKCCYVPVARIYLNLQSPGQASE